ncbi:MULTISPECIES: hypothetical protein [unclassified Leptolyngbya]
MDGANLQWASLMNVTPFKY